MKYAFPARFALIAAAALTAFTGGVASLHAAELSTRGQMLDRVAAVVNDGVVTTTELDEQIEMIAERLREQRTQLPPADVLRSQVLDRLILQEIQAQRASKLGLKISDEQVNAALNDIAVRNNISLAQLPQALASQGVDYAGYRENMRKEIALSALRQRDVLQRINVTPRELDQFIDRQKRQPSEMQEYNVSHILIAVPEDANSAKVEELAARAKDIQERASGSEDFGRLAVAYSNSQTALEGGALGWRKGPELPTFLSEVIVKLKSGDVSQPLRTPSGFHLVKLNGIRAVGNQSAVVEQTHARHILLKPNQLQDDATVRQRLTTLRERIEKGEEFATLASSISEDSGSAVNGGDLDWMAPGSFVPEFEAQLAQLKDGEISEPFRTNFGWHIVQVLGRRQFDTTDENVRQRAFAQLRESKADEETELWLRRLRDEAFVEIIS
ncbi:MAG: peptidylprolyl isomerase [Steroidobacteraceae bacterium]